MPWPRPLTAARDSSPDSTRDGPSSWSLHIRSTYPCQRPGFAHPHAFQTAQAVIRIDDSDVLVPEDGDLADHIAGACRKAFPARLAPSGVQPDEPRLQVIPSRGTHVVRPLFWEGRGASCVEDDGWRRLAQAPPDQPPSLSDERPRCGNKPGGLSAPSEARRLPQTATAVWRRWLRKGAAREPHVVDRWRQERGARRRPVHLGSS